MDQAPTTSRRQFIATTAAAAAGLHHRPPARPRRPALRRAERQGERRHHRRRRTGADQHARPLPGGRLPDHRPRRPGGGVGPVAAGTTAASRPRAGAGRKSREHYAAKTPNYTCAVYEDFRVMLEKEKAIDAVLIATPDHLHAYVSIFAMKAGKHVYCEKPLTHNIQRGAPRSAHREGDGRRHADGQSGPLERRTSPDRRVAQRRRHRRRARGARLERRCRKPRTSHATGGPAVKPAGLNWDLWLGPRPERPYSGAVAPFVWRWIWEFGNGTMPDMASHHFDPAFNALAPRRAASPWRRAPRTSIRRSRSWAAST